MGRNIKEGCPFFSSNTTVNIDNIDELEAANVKINTGYPVVVESRTFTETAGAGTYTATVTIPAGAVVLDVIWHNNALWTATTSATLNVGDADAAGGYITAVDAKAAPAADTAGMGGISSFLSDTGTGAYKGLTKYYAAEGTITATVVTVGAAGNAGRSRLYVKYAVPTVVAAAKA